MIVQISNSVKQVVFYLFVIQFVRNRYKKKEASWEASSLDWMADLQIL